MCASVYAAVGNARSDERADGRTARRDAPNIVKSTIQIAAGVPSPSPVTSLLFLSPVSSCLPCATHSLTHCRVYRRSTGRRAGSPSPHVMFLPLCVVVKVRGHQAIAGPADRLSLRASISRRVPRPTSTPTVYSNGTRRWRQLPLWNTDSDVQIIKKNLRHEIFCICLPLRSLMQS